MLSNDMKIAVLTNNLGGQIWYRSLDPVKKRRHFHSIYIIEEILYFAKQIVYSQKKTISYFCSFDFLELSLFLFSHF